MERIDLMVHSFSEAEVCRWWFGDSSDEPDGDRLKLWFVKDKRNDYLVRRHFLSLLTLASEHGLDHWSDKEEGRLALSVIYGQFPVRIFRGNKIQFSYEKSARQHCRRYLEEVMASNAHGYQKAIFCLPLVCSESAQDLNLGLEQLEYLAMRYSQAGWLRYFRGIGRMNVRLLQQFGRLPQRNRMLGRKSLPLESAYLDEVTHLFEYIA
ncbi:MAG: DUF924 domain-containing protein [Pseudomonadales bacterium]|nr:DUF924 domain-containing protein [Pseudomonadales bacterium]